MVTGIIKVNVKDKKKPYRRIIISVWLTFRGLFFSPGMYFVDIKDL